MFLLVYLQSGIIASPASVTALHTACPIPLFAGCKSYLREPQYKERLRRCSRSRGSIWCAVHPAVGTCRGMYVGVWKKWFYLAQDPGLKVGYATFRCVHTSLQADVSICWSIGPSLGPSIYPQPVFIDLGKMGEKDCTSLQASSSIFILLSICLWVAAPTGDEVL